jgi:hypothetical protein
VGRDLLGCWWTGGSEEKTKDGEVAKRHGRGKATSVERPYRMTCVVSLSSRQPCATAICHFDGQPSCLWFGYERQLLITRLCRQASQPVGWNGMVDPKGEGRAEGAEGALWIDRQAGRS